MQHNTHTHTHTHTEQQQQKKGKKKKKRGWICVLCVSFKDNSKGVLRAFSSGKGGKKKQKNEEEEEKKKANTYVHKNRNSTSQA